MKNTTHFAPLNVNECRLLAYALMGFLSYMRERGIETDAFFVNGSSKIGDDAVYLFGVPTIFEIAKQEHLPKVMQDIILTLDEYGIMPQAVRDALIEQHLAGLGDYLSSSSSEGGEFRREIFNWIRPISPPTS